MTNVPAAKRSAGLRPDALGNGRASVPRTGVAQIEIQSVAGQSAVTAAFATSPLKLLSPVSRGQSVWACTSSFGGGLVAGDETRLDVRLGAHARCYLGTQAATKVYRNPAHLPCGHQTRAKLGESSLLMFAPDPIQPFACSVYSQCQEFHLAAGAGLAMVDWFTSGRAARGERWAFSQFESRNAVWLSGELIFLDSLRLDPADVSLASAHATGRFNCFASLLLLGEPLKELAANLLAEVAQRPVERRAAMVSSASPTRHGALLRVAAEEVEQVGQELHHHLKPATALLGDNPWARKW